MVPVLILTLLLVGCTGERSTGMPSPLVGTWIEVGTTEFASAMRIRTGQPIGFLVLSADQVVVSLSGQPRLAETPQGLAISPTTNAGRIDLDHGLRIFFASGETIVQQQLGDQTVASNARYLDIDLIQGGTAKGDVERHLSHCRLWSENSLRLPISIGSSMTTAAISAKAAGASPEPVPASDELFRSQVDTLTVAELSSAVPGLIHGRQTGTSAAQLQAMADGCLSAVQRDLVSRLEQVDAGDVARTRQVVDEVARRQRAISSFAAAFATWLNSRA